MYREWIRKGLMKKGKSGKGLARALGVDNSVVSRIIHGKREIKAHELPIIAEYLELPIPTSQGATERPTINRKPATFEAGSGSRLGRDSPRVELVPVRAKLARGVWREDGGSALAYTAASIPAVIDQRLADIEHYACEFEDVPGRFGIFVPYNSYRTRPTSGDTVHVRRTRGTLHEDALRVIEASRGEVRLVSVEDPDDVVKLPSDDPDEKVAIRGLIVGRYEILNF